MKTTILDCKIVNFNLDEFANSSLTDIIPFEIKRIFYLHNCNEFSSRGGHAHINCKQYIISINSNLLIKLSDGENTISYNLENKKNGLYIPPGIWNDIYEFNKESVCIVFASENYEESDYIRNFNNFIDYKNDS